MKTKLLLLLSTVVFVAACFSKAHAQPGPVQNRHCFKPCDSLCNHNQSLAQTFSKTHAQAAFDSMRKLAKDSATFWKGTKCDPGLPGDPGLPSQSVCECMDRREPFDTFVCGFNADDFKKFAGKNGAIDTIRFNKGQKSLFDTSLWNEDALDSVEICYFADTFADKGFKATAQYDTVKAIVMYARADRVVVADTCKLVKIRSGDRYVHLTVNDPNRTLVLHPFYSTYEPIYENHKIILPSGGDLKLENALLIKEINK